MGMIFVSACLCRRLRITPNNKWHAEGHEFNSHRLQIEKTPEKSGVFYFIDELGEAVERHLCRRQFLLPFVELVAQAAEDGRVHLADAAFGKVQRLADLLHGHFFEVIQDDDEPLRA
jgi:hypothetical protein